MMPNSGHSPNFILQPPSPPSTSSNNNNDNNSSYTRVILRFLISMWDSVVALLQRLRVPAILFPSGAYTHPVEPDSLARLEAGENALVGRPACGTPRNRGKAPPFPVCERPMKVLLVFLSSSPASSTTPNSPSEEDMNFRCLKSMKTALHRVGLVVCAASTIAQAQSLFQRYSHDIVYIYRSPSLTKVINEEQFNEEDAVCKWLSEQDQPPFSIVAVQEDSKEDEDTIVQYLNHLFSLGYTRIFAATTNVSLCMQELLQANQNDFVWSLRQETTKVLQMALDSVSDAVEVTDDEFRVQYINRGFEKLLGSSRDKVMGRRVLTGNWGAVESTTGYNGMSIPHNLAHHPRQRSHHLAPHHRYGSSISPTNRIRRSSLSGIRLSQASPLNTLIESADDHHENDLCHSLSPTNPSAAALVKASDTDRRHSAVALSSNIPSPSFTNGLSASSNSVVGRRRKSLPNGQLLDNESSNQTCRMFSVQTKDGRTTNYVTIRNAGLHPPNGTRDYLELGFKNYLKASPAASSDIASASFEPPIQKVINLIHSMQRQSNPVVCNELQRVLDILQASDIYSFQPCQTQDPATTDLVEGLLSNSRTFATETENRRRSLPYASHSSAGSRSSIETKRENLKAIPEDINECMEGDERWDFDILHLETVTNKRPLRFLALRVCERFGVPQFLNISTDVLGSWLTVVEDRYRAANTYHNSTHAADVMQSSAYFLERKLLKNVFGPIDEVATILASIVHDVDHPGRTNPFLINNRDKLAILYNDMAVLESHHVSLCFQLTSKDERINIFKNLSREDYSLLRQYMIDMVLATEMAKHFEHLTKFLNIAQKKPSQYPSNDSDLTCSDDKELCPASFPSASLQNTNTEYNSHDDWIQFLQQADCRANIRRMLIKCSDISNPTRPLSLCKIWAERIAEEYFLQTDDEKRLGLPVVMPWFDRQTCNIPKSQLSFIDFFLKNMITAWSNFIEAPELSENLAVNHAYWTMRLQTQSVEECAESPTSVSNTSLTKAKCESKPSSITKTKDGKVKVLMEEYTTDPDTDDTDSQVSNNVVNTDDVIT